MQGGGAAVESDAMLGAAKPGKLLLELRHIRAQAKGTIIQRTRDGGINFIADRPHLRGQVEVRNSGGGFGLNGHFATRLEQMLFRGTISKWLESNGPSEKLGICLKTGGVW